MSNKKILLLGLSTISASLQSGIFDNFNCPQIDLSKLIDSACNKTQAAANAVANSRVGQKASLYAQTAKSKISGIDLSGMKNSAKSGFNSACNMTQGVANKVANSKISQKISQSAQAAKPYVAPVAQAGLGYSVAGTKLVGKCVKQAALTSGKFAAKHADKAYQASKEKSQLYNAWYLDIKADLQKDLLAAQEAAIVDVASIKVEGRLVNDLGLEMHAVNKKLMQRGELIEKNLIVKIDSIEGFSAEQKAIMCKWLAKATQGDLFRIQKAVNNKMHEILSHAMFAPVKNAQPEALPKGQKKITDFFKPSVAAAAVAGSVAGVVASASRSEERKD